MVQWRQYPAAPQVTSTNSSLTACLMNLLVNWPSWPVVLIHSRCFSLCPLASQVYSPTQLPIEQQFLIASLKLLGIIHLERQWGLFSVLMSPDNETAVGILVLLWHWPGLLLALRLPVAALIASLSTEGLNHVFSKQLDLRGFICSISSKVLEQVQQIKTKKRDLYLVSLCSAWVDS